MSNNERKILMARLKFSGAQESLIEAASTAADAFQRFGAAMEKIPAGLQASFQAAEAEVGLDDPDSAKAFRALSSD